MKLFTEINEEVVERSAKHCRERGVIMPTFAQMKDPALVPEKIKKRLGEVGLWDVDPVNLFRITWKNEAVSHGGGFGNGTWVEFPSELTGVDARIIGIVGKYFPTGAHKVGAAYGCLAPQLASGQFDPTSQKAVWPSTGNYCRGGAFDSILLGCDAIGILPEEMSRERFEWLKEIGIEVIATPGCESNVKEIYDMCWEIKKTRKDCVIFNQFEEFGNPIWHYHVTGSQIQDVFNEVANEGDRLSGYVSATGSGGTIAAGDFLRTLHPALRVVATEALQCPTLLQFGFGGHRIEGIGDKHVPWVHNVRNTDMIAAIDDEQCMSLLRLFNEDAGRKSLEANGVDAEWMKQFELMGVSGICNMVAAIKTARYYEMNSKDVIFLPLTDSLELYGSRLEELTEEHGAYTETNAVADFSRYLQGIGIDNLRELNYQDRKALHNFKYFTWVEQQGRDVDELRQLWDPDFWTETFAQVDELDKLIEAFNAKVGLND